MKMESRVFRLKRTDKPNMKQYIGEDFLLIGDDVEFLNLLHGPLSKGLGGDAFMVNINALKSDFVEMNLNNKDDMKSVADGISMETVMDSLEQIIKDFEKEEKSKPKQKSEPTLKIIKEREETQLNRIEEKLDKILAFCRIN